MATTKKPAKAKPGFPYNLTELDCLLRSNKDIVGFVRIEKGAYIIKVFKRKGDKVGEAIPQTELDKIEVKLRKTYKAII